MSRNGHDPKVAKRLERYAEAVRLVDEGSARRVVVEAVECVRQGLTWRQACRKLGISHSAYFQRLNDPTDAANRARKRRHSGVCEECGGPTCGGAGRENAPKRCATCEATRNLDRNERIIELWEAGWTAPEIGAELGMSATAVSSWVYRERHLQGLPIALHRLRDREAWPTIERMWDQDASVAEIALRVGTTPDSVAMMVQAMRQKGIPLKRRVRERDEERRAEFVRLWNEGQTLAQLGEHFGISRSGAGSYISLLRRDGYDVPPRRRLKVAA